MKVITETYDEYVRPEFEYFVYVQLKILRGPNHGKVFTTKIPTTLPILDESEIQQVIDDHIKQIEKSFEGIEREYFLAHRKFKVYKVRYEEIQI